MKWNTSGRKNKCFHSTHTLLDANCLAASLKVFCGNLDEKPSEHQMTWCESSLVLTTLLHHIRQTSRLKRSRFLSSWWFVRALISGDRSRRLTSLPTWGWPNCRGWHAFQMEWAWSHFPHKLWSAGRRWGQDPLTTAYCHRTLLQAIYVLGQPTRHLAHLWNDPWRKMVGTSHNRPQRSIPNRNRVGALLFGDQFISPSASQGFFLSVLVSLR